MTKDQLLSLLRETLPLLSLIERVDNGINGLKCRDLRQRIQSIPNNETTSVVTIPIKDQT